MGFGPTMVLNAVFDNTERKQFARRLTSGLPVEDVRLKGADVPDDSRVWHLETANGLCQMPPLCGVLLVLTDERGCETILGFFRFPDTLRDTKGRIVAETGLGGAWYFRDHVKSGDPRFRRLVKSFAEAGYVEKEQDDFAGSL